VAASRQLAPLRLRPFRLLFLSTLGSSFGSLLAAIALAIDVKDRTNAGVWVGAVLVVEFVPMIAVGLTLGPLLDRLERRKLMVAADLVRAAMFCILPFATNAPTIVALAAVVGLANGFFQPAVYAGVPNLVSEEELTDANALLQTVENLSWAVGPVLGGLITAAAGPHTAYWVNAVSFFVSAALIVQIPKEKLQSAVALTRGHWTDLADGFRAVLRSRLLLAVLVAWSVAGLGVGSIRVIEVFFEMKSLLEG
jgi:MFS family permease